MNNNFKVGDFVKLIDKSCFPNYQGKQEVVSVAGTDLCIKYCDNPWYYNNWELYVESVKKDLGKHYRFSFKGLKIDVYRILEIFQITNPAQQHAIKKLLRAGKSIKPLSQDIDEVILTLERWKEMIIENE